MSSQTRTSGPTTRRMSVVGTFVCWAAFVVACVSNLYGIYAPSQPGPALFTGADKLWHLLSFAFVMGSGVLAGIRPRWLAAALVVHAIGSELIQHFLLADRSGDPLDVVADAVGIALGWLVARALLQRRQIAR